MDKFFKVEVLVTVPKEEWETWDSSCDETFSIPNFVDPSNPGTHISDYSEISQEDFNAKKHRVFDENGGI